MADQPKKKPLNNKTMNDARPNHKAFKQKKDDMGYGKSYRGSHTRGLRLTEAQKIHQGQGMYRNAGKQADLRRADPWVGVTRLFGMFDPAQARENRHLYPHLFTD